MSPMITEPTTRPDGPPSGSRELHADETRSVSAWRFKIFIDGDCPLCAKEARLMRRMDRGRGALVLEDIAAPSFEPSRYGVTYEQMMATIHGQMPDGRVVTGVEVFRQAYAAVGWGWLLSWTRLPVVCWLSDRVYRWFAKHRLTLTGRRRSCAGACGVSPAQR